MRILTNISHYKLSWVVFLPGFLLGKHQGPFHWGTKVLIISIHNKNHTQPHVVKPWWGRGGGGTHVPSLNFKNGRFLSHIGKEAMSLSILCYYICHHVSRCHFIYLMTLFSGHVTYPNLTFTGPLWWMILCMYMHMYSHKLLLLSLLAYSQ